MPLGFNLAVIKIYHWLVLVPAKKQQAFVRECRSSVLDVHPEHTCIHLLTTCYSSFLPLTPRWENL